MTQVITVYTINTLSAGFHQVKLPEMGVILPVTDDDIFFTLSGHFMLFCSRSPDHLSNSFKVPVLEVLSFLKIDNFTVRTFKT